MRAWQKVVLFVAIASLGAVPGMAIEEENEGVDGCCMSCAHYYYTTPDGQTREYWHCMGFDCHNGFRDCWEHHDGSKPCIEMWSCSVF